MEQVFVQTEEFMKLLLAIFYLFFVSCTNAHTMSKKPIVERKIRKKRAFGKSKGYFQIKFQSIDNGNGDITLTADIIPRKKMMQTKVRWKLPEHLLIIGGEKTSTLDFQVSQPQQVSITFEKQRLKENDQIILFVTKVMNGENHGASHSFIYHEKNNVESSGIRQKTKKHRKFIE